MPVPPGITMVSKLGASASEQSAPNSRPDALWNALPSGLRQMTS